MKYIVIALSGAADQPAEELQGKTPLEVAKIPHLHALAKSGQVGKVKLVSDRAGASADMSLLNLLGYDADKVYTGRAPLEAANLELKLEENEVPFRMNFITESDGILADPTAGQISNKEAKALLNFLNKKLASDFVRFFAGTGYRHIAVIKDSHGYDALSCRTVAPREILGQKIDQHLPKGPGSELLKKMMFDAKLLLQDHEINQVRVDLMENPANMIWFWGQGRPPSLEKFSRTLGLSGAIVTNADYAKGIGRIAGLTVLEVGEGQGTPAEMNEKRSRLLLDALHEKDFVCLHITDCDEASLEGDYRAKVSALEAVDYFILSKVKNYLDKTKEVRVLVTPCHGMPWKTGKRTREAVPFVIAGKKITSDDTESFSELAASTSPIKMKKDELLPAFLGVVSEAVAS